MNTVSTTKASLGNSCHPTITILCIISCMLCTIIMIWGVYAMRVDMARMEQMMIPVASNTQSDPMVEHCKMMPNMIGCEKFR